MNNRNRNKGDGLAVASLICGIFGCVIMCSVVFSIFFGAMAIILALLARGSSMKVTKNCKAGFILGIIAIICSIVIFAISLHSIITTYGSLDAFLTDFMSMYNQIFSEIYGVTFDEMLQMQ